MAADLRVLKLALLAETKDFVSGLDKATKETKTFNQKLGKAPKRATAKLTQRLLLAIFKGVFNCFFIAVFQFGSR